MKKIFALLLMFIVSTFTVSVLAQTEGEVTATDTDVPEAAVAANATPEATPEPTPVTTPSPEPTPAYGWKPEMVGNLNLAQNSFDNWAPGGDNSYSWQSVLRGKYDHDQEAYYWANSGKLDFGQNQTGTQIVKKTSDEIRLESVFTLKMKLHVSPYAALKGETQFTAGYDYSPAEPVKVSNFLDPGYFTESVGVGYAQDKWLTTRLGFAARQTVARDHVLRYIADPVSLGGNSYLQNKLGLESVTDVSWKIAENVLFVSKLELFHDFVQLDLAWDNMFTASVSKYINTSFNIKVVYDPDVSPLRQIKQALTLGLTYTFID